MPVASHLRSIPLRPGARLAVVLLFFGNALASAAPATPPPAAIDLPLAASGRYESFDAAGAMAAPLPGGGFAVAWSEGDSPLALDVRLQYVRPDGTFALGSQGVVVAGTLESERAAAVAVGPGGGAYVAWVATLSHSAETRVVVQSFDAAGFARWPEEGVSPTAPTTREVQTEPRLLPAPGGGLYVCFTRDEGASALSREIACQRLGPGGERLWGDDGRAAGGIPGTREIPRAVDDGGGGLLVFWLNRRDLFTAGAPDLILIEGQRFDAGGRALWGARGKLLADTALPTSLTSYPWGVDAVPDGTGGAVFAYRAWSRRGERGDDVLAQRVDRKGRLLWRQPAIVLDGAGDQILGTLIPTRDGGAVAAVALDLADDAPLRLTRLGGNGRPRWGNAGLALEGETGANAQASVRGAFDGTHLHLTWVRRPGWPQSRRTEIRGATFDARGHRADDPEPLAELADGNQDLAALLLDSTRRQALALWTSVDFRSQRGADAAGLLFIPSDRPDHR
jgi:hypothetical protein